MRHWRARAVCAIAIAALSASVARAGDRASVTVLESGDAVPTADLVAALRLHLGAKAEVGVGPRMIAGAMADRIRHASSLVHDGDAVLVVWIERIPGNEATHDDYIVYAAGADPARALIEVVRIAADGRADTVRIMALKVANLVDIVLSEPAPPGDVTRPFGRGGAALPGPAPSYAPWVAVGAAGGVLGGDVGAQAGVSFAAGLARTTPALELSAQVGVRWLSGVRATNERGVIAVGEIAVALGVRASRRWRGHGLGVDVELGARRLDAEGETFDGRTDQDSALVPFVGAGAHGEIGLGHRLGLGLHVGAEAALVRQRVSLRHVPAADFGRFRAVGGLSLVWTWD